jgi:predicted membrane channel-forming protein YqfA (hemolysin III family)
LTALAAVERKPKLFDYFAGAILTNGLATVAIYLAAWEKLFEYLLLPLWVVSAAVATYLVCMRATSNHLVTGAKTALVSILIGFVMVPVMQSLDFASIALILICYLIGSIGGAYYALREQLKRKKQAATPPPTVEP